MTHAPKYRALDALSQGLLSPDAAKLVETHLSSCPVCRRAHAAIDAYSELCEEVRDSVVRIDFDRVAESLVAEGALLLRDVAAYQALADVAEYDVPNLSWDRISSALVQEGALRLQDVAAHEAIRKVTDSDIPVVDWERVENGLVAEGALSLRDTAAHQVLSELGAETAPQIDWGRVESGLAARLEAERTTPQAPAKKAHKPKWRALVAYHEGALSDSGRAILERHAESCEVCADVIARMQAYDELSEETRNSVVPINFAKMELPMRREAKAAAARQRRASWIPVLALAAAVLLGLFAWRAFGGDKPVQEEGIARQTVRQTEEEPALAPEVPEAESPLLEPVVVAVRGVANALGAESERVQLTPGSTLGETQAIEVEGEVHVQLDHRQRFALVDGALALHQLREAQTEVRLTEGTLHSSVLQGSSYVSLGAEYAVRAEVSTFSMHVTEEHLSVRVDEGRLDILRDGEVIQELVAPAEWSTHQATVASRTPVCVLSEGASAELQIPDMEGVQEWQIGDCVFESGVNIFLPVGEHTVRARNAEGEEVELSVRLAPEGSTLEERRIRFGPRTPRMGVLTPDQINSVVRPRIRVLRHCYERTLRRNFPDFRGEFVLQVDVGSAGEVTRARLRSEGEMPPPFVTCISREARSWQFPEPAGGPRATFRLPLRFEQR